MIYLIPHRSKDMINPLLSNYLKNRDVIEVCSDAKDDVSTGGAHTNRWLRFLTGLDKNGFVVKCDVDTIFPPDFEYDFLTQTVRPYHRLFGCLVQTGSGVGVSGKAFVTTSEICQRIVESDYLSSEIYKNNPHFQYCNKRLKKSIVCEDAVLVDVCKRLHIEITGHPAFEFIQPYLVDRGIRNVKHNDRERA